MKNFLLKAFSVLILIGLPITFIGCGSSDNSTNLNNSNVKANDVTYEESPTVDPIINILSIANKTTDEVKNILGEPSSTEISKYGLKYIYLDGKVEILFFRDVASHISVESDDGNIELLGFNKDSLKDLPIENKIEKDSYIRYNNLEGIYSISYDKSTDLFVILTKEEYDFDYYQNDSSILNSNDKYDERKFTTKYYSELDSIISKYNENYSDSYYNEVDSLLNEIYTLLKENIDKETFSKIESEEIEWINYKESKNNLKDKINDTEMRIRDLLYIMGNYRSIDAMNKYIPYFKSENNNLTKESKTNNSVKSEIILSEIPDLLGLDVETAKNLLNNSHLKCSIEEENIDEANYDGKVLSQSIEAKSQVAEWSTVKITVGKYVNIPQ